MALAAEFELPRLGSPEAPLVIYEFSDYMCPYCQKNSVENIPLLVERYVDPGHVALVFVDFPLQSHGLPAVMGSESAHCASEQDAYWPMHDAIFERQSELSALIQSNDEAQVRAKLVEIAQDIDLDGGEVDQCLETRKYRPIVASVFGEAIGSGVQATPTLLIGEEAVPGFLPFEDLATIIDAQLEKQREGE
jgi:protein-disulfide isomerase